MHEWYEKHPEFQPSELKAFSGNMESWIDRKIALAVNAVFRYTRVCSLPLINVRDKKFLEVGGYATRTKLINELEARLPSLGRKQKSFRAQGAPASLMCQVKIEMKRLRAVMSLLRMPVAF